MSINEIIGINIQNLRNRNHLSIGQLAELTGLSKAVISQIEKGSSNPTINTIWKLAGALHVPYSAILEPQKVRITRVAVQDLIPQEDEDGHYRISCYFPGTEERDFELFLIELDPKVSHISDGHMENAQEYLVVKQGQLSLEVGDESFLLREGDAIYFDASTRHCYRNTGRKMTQVICINYYPEHRPL